MQVVDPRTDGELLVAAAHEAAPRYVLRPEPARNWLYGIASNQLCETRQMGAGEETFSLSGARRRAPTAQRGSALLY
jgi:hypothetical protein